jgi:hypothetical protein
MGRDFNIILTIEDGQSILKTADEALSEDLYFKPEHECRAYLMIKTS